MPLPQIHTPISGNTAVRVPAASNVIDVLKSLGGYDTFLLALQVSILQLVSLSCQLLASTHS